MCGGERYSKEESWVKRRKVLNRGERLKEEVQESRKEKIWAEKKDKKKKRRNRCNERKEIEEKGRKEGRKG